MFRHAYRLFRPVLYVAGGSAGLLSSYSLLRDRDFFPSQHSLFVSKFRISQSLLSYCDEAPTTGETHSKDGVEEQVEVIVVPDVAEGEEEEWIAEKEKCSFCKHFMLSPCRDQFKKWSKCVDIAKSMDKDFVKSCAPYTRALMECTTQHSEYFSATRPDEGDDVEEEEEDAEDSEQPADQQEEEEVVQSKDETPGKQ